MITTAMRQAAMVAIASLFGLAAGNVFALDTSKEILCVSLDVFECVDGGKCDEVRPEEVAAPTFLRINVKKKEIRASQERPPSIIDHIEEVEDRLVLQGVEDGDDDEVDGSGWTLSIEKATGRMVATAAASRAAIVIFGACTEL